MPRSVKRKTNVNYDIPKDMAASLDTIVTKEKSKHGIDSRSELIRRVLSDLIGYYENDKFYNAKNASRSFLTEKEESSNTNNPQLLF